MGVRHSILRPGWDSERVAFLVEAAGQRAARPQRSETLLSILAQLEAQDRRRSAG